MKMIIFTLILSISLPGMIFSFVGIITCKKDEKGKPLGIIGFIVSSVAFIYRNLEFNMILGIIAVVLVGGFVCIACIIKSKKQRNHPFSQ